MTTEGPKTFNVVVDGKSLTVTVSSGGGQTKVSGDKGIQIAVDGKSFYVQIEAEASPTAPTLIAPPAASPAPQRAAPTRQPTAAPIAPPTADGDTVMAAPIPGTIVRYTVAEAQPVKAGETVVVLEAMKMENTLPSPVDGVIKQISLQAGAKVARGDVLLIIGPA
jgi:biotin carboxyl carrier protein